MFLSMDIRRTLASSDIEFTSAELTQSTLSDLNTGVHLLQQGWTYMTCTILVTLQIFVLLEYSTLRVLYFASTDEVAPPLS